MEKNPRIVLIHATRVAVAPIEQAAKRLWPDAETISILEESLSVDRAKETELSDVMKQRIFALAHYATNIDADGVLFTCSAFGEAIETADVNSTIPVMKPNEAMFNSAFEYGDRVAMLYTFSPAAAGMEDEFYEAAKLKNSDAMITSIFCDGALAAKQAGDHKVHDLIIANAAAKLNNYDVILLAQFSMADAAELASSKTSIPILTSPDAAISELHKRIKTT